MIQVGKIKLSCKLVNISTTGLLVQSPFQLHWHPTVRVAFWVPTAEQRIYANARVVRQTRTGGGGEIGMAFLDLSGQQRATVDGFVEHWTVQAAGALAAFDDLSRADEGITWRHPKKL